MYPNEKPFMEGIRNKKFEISKWSNKVLLGLAGGGKVDSQRFGENSEGRL